MRTFHKNIIGVEAENPFEFGEVLVGSPEKKVLVLSGGIFERMANGRC